MYLLIQKDIDGSGELLEKTAGIKKSHIPVSGEISLVQEAESSHAFRGMFCPTAAKGRRYEEDFPATALHPGVPGDRR
jgi:hypothetical protein